MIVLHRIHRMHHAVWDENKTVYRWATAAERAFRFFEHANNPKNLVIDLNLFVERLVSGEESVRDIVADDRDFAAVLIFGIREEAPARDAHFTCVGVARPDAAQLRRADFV